MLDIENLVFDEKGLIPAIIQDYNTKKVLTLAYMNKESLTLSIEKKMTCFYSRKRKELWLKGETSGNFQHIINIEVIKDGPACHEGYDSCFNYPVLTSNEKEFNLDSLMDLLVDRKLNRKEGSYTSYLFEKGLDKILKKIGEESTEVIIAAKACDKKETIYEIADLTYHIMVLMANENITIDEIKSELKSRHIIDKKIKQEKMTS